MNALTLSPLTANAYVDEAVFQQELSCIFDACSTYIGHEQSVPNLGDWRTLAQEESGRVLVRNELGVELLSNVCRHRQAIILAAQTEALAPDAPAFGNLDKQGGRIVCPLHHWTYDQRGQLLQALFESGTLCLTTLPWSVI